MKKESDSEDVIKFVTAATNAVPDRRFYEGDKLILKFKDTHAFRLRKGKLRVKSSKEGLSDDLKMLLEELKGTLILRLHSVPEAKIDEWVAIARSKSKGHIADLNNYYLVLLDKGEDAFEVTKRFLELNEVEFARPLLRLVPPPVPPDYTSRPAPGTTTPFQGYLYDAPGGIDAIFAWSRPGGDGTGVTICDVESNWNFNHREFSNNGGLRLAGGSPIDFRDYRSHGTAVVGIYGSNNDFQEVTPTGATTPTAVSIGTTGIAYNATKLAASVSSSPIYNISGAITTAMERMSAGDIILVEQHLPGPNSDYSPQGVIGMIRNGLQQGFVPVEWYRENYDTIRVAVENEFIVVEAAGNGEENLDDAVYHPQPNRVQRLLGIRPHAPFLLENDSGAILVGAGTSDRRSRLWFSNYGRRVNVQGWGNNVVTTESPGSNSNPNLYNLEGDNAQYTSSFGGTSSASPIVAGACACLQGRHVRLFGHKATPGQIRNLILQTHSDQTGNTSEHIGPLPDLRQAINFLESLVPPNPFIQEGGVYPIPFHLYIGAAPRVWTDFSDVKIWYTLNGPDPVEGSPGSLLFCSGAACQDMNSGTLEINQPGRITVRARVVATNQWGHRVSSEVEVRVFELYQLLPPPANVHASCGTFPDRIRIEWDALISLATYDVFFVSGSEANPRYYKANNVPIEGTKWDYVDEETAPLVHEVFAVRGTLMDGKWTQYSPRVEGWKGITSPNLRATKGELTDKIHVSWDPYNFSDVTGLSTEYYLYRSESSDPDTGTLIAHLQKSWEEFDINGHRRTFPVPAPTEFNDMLVIAEKTYFYWVKAAGTTPDGDIVETPLSNTDYGFIASP